MANTDIQDRGDMECVADPSWEALWSRWDLEDVQGYLAQAAAFGPLSENQAAALLQGLPPPPKGWQDPCTVLAEFECVVQRLRYDIGREHFPANPTPQELAAWCDSINHSLPVPFVDALRTAASGAATATPMAAQSSSTYERPSWVVLPPASPSTPLKPRPGRPRTAEARNDALIKEGTKIINEHADRGVIITLPEIANQLAGALVATGMTKTSIERRLKGQLPVVVAKARAMAIQASQRGK